jgi:Protein of unknown function (DUF3309)
LKSYEGNRSSGDAPPAEFGPAAVTRMPAKVGNMLWTVILIILILVLLGALPTWPYSSGWGYYPSGGVGLIVVIVILVLLLR